jgi:superoxide dismutase, Cu-Zn family
MRFMSRCSALVVTVVVCGTTSGGGVMLVTNAQQGQTPATARAELKDAKGQTVGKAELTQAANGVLVRLTLSKGPSGARAFHIHETGKCDAPSFESAGAHANPAKAQHGFHNPNGPHGGDLPNLHIPRGGTLEVEFLAANVSLAPGANTLLDADGAALVIHQATDDYRTDPAGEAGDRVACGVVTR